MVHWDLHLFVILPRQCLNSLRVHRCHKIIRSDCWCRRVHEWLFRYSSLRWIVFCAHLLSFFSRRRRLLFVPSLQGWLFDLFLCHLVNLYDLLRRCLALSLDCLDMFDDTFCALNRHVTFCRLVERAIGVLLSIIILSLLVWSVLVGWGLIWEVRSVAVEFILTEMLAWISLLLVIDYDLLWPKLVILSHIVLEFLIHLRWKQRLMALNLGQAIRGHIIAKSLLCFKHIHLVCSIFEVGGNRITWIVDISE